jgi:hypothetical protein
MTTRRDDDTQRDAHLLAALRHAPDREATPPPEVTARILAAARAAVRAEGAAPAWTQRLAAWWGQPRVGVGAAFGTLMAAVLVGVLWSTREPLPRAEPGAPAAVAAGPVTGRDNAAVPSEQQVAAADALREAPSSAPASVTQRPAPPPAARAAERKPSAEQRAPKGRASGESREVQPVPADAPAPAAAPAVPPPPPATAPAPKQAEPARPQAESDAAAQSSAAAAAGRQRSAELGRLLSRREDANAASTPAVAADARLSSQATRAAADPLSSLDALLLGPPPDAARASWRSTARTLPHGAAQQAWWREMHAATQGRWQPADATQQAFAPWLTLAIDGRDRARWWLQGEHLLLLDAQGAAWRAPVSESQARAWSEAVAGW